jgi:GDPmannose 4,6-dehydratase
LEFKGKGSHEIAIVKSINKEIYDKVTQLSVWAPDQVHPVSRTLKIGKEVLAVDPTYFRPTEVDLLIGDSTKAKEKLGWVPEYDLKGLVKEMMQSDLKLMKKDVDLLNAGHEILKQTE